jgi:membrane-associated phospholipid phosphatase
VAILLIVLWGLLYSALRLAPLALAILSAALRGLAEYPAVARRLERHPGAVRWIERRLDRTNFTGLPLSLLGAVFLYIGAVWLDSAIDFLSGDPMLQLDGRLAELVRRFHSPMPIRIASLVTALGGWHVVAPLLVSVLGNTATVTLLKLAFARPRSPLGYFAETSGSFPSGHAAASVAVYGMVMYIFWRAGRLRAETAVLVAGLLAFGIGTSRVYLVEHYLSDVLNGWLVGAMWLTLGIAVSEWLASHPHAERNRPPRPWRLAGYAAIVALVGLGVANVWRYDDPRNPPVSTTDILLANPQNLANAADFQVVTESLLGTPLRPVSLIVLTADDVRLADAMRAAGWSESRPPGPGLIVDALLSSIEGREDPTVETVSHFWRSQPNDLAYGYRPDPSVAPGQDPKARFWRSEYVTADGLRAYVGTVGLDQVGESTTADPGPGDPASPDAVAQGLLRAGATEVTRIDLPRTAGGSGATPTARVLRLP